LLASSDRSPPMANRRRNSAQRRSFGMCLDVVSAAHRSHPGPQSLHPLATHGQSQCGGSLVKALQRKQKRPGRMVDPRMEYAQAHGIVVVASYFFSDMEAGDVWNEMMLVGRSSAKETDGLHSLIQNQTYVSGCDQPVKTNDSL
jgi:hypothetical protein